MIFNRKKIKERMIMTNDNENCKCEAKHVNKEEWDKVNEEVRKELDSFPKVSSDILSKYESLSFSAAFPSRKNLPLGSGKTISMRKDNDKE